MTFVRKFNGKTERSADPSPVVACYRCPEHGEFDVEVMRDGRGEAPDTIACPEDVGHPEFTVADVACGLLATWIPSSSIACRVRRIEAIKGRWEKPERKTYLDTRDLAEGMDPDDFAAKRAAVWEERRQEDVMAVKKGFG